MLIASGFSWFHLIPGVEDGSLLPFAHDHGYTFVSAWLVTGLVILFAFAARSGLNAAIARGGREQYEPDASLSAFAAAEVAIGAFYDLMKGMMDPKYARAMSPLVLGLFFYILFCNLTSLVPGFQPPTDNVNTNVGMALVVMLSYNLLGLWVDAKSYWMHLRGPMLALSVLILPLELLTVLILRPMSLTLRLTGNIFGDHTVFNIMSDLVPVFVPVPFLILGTLVAFIQAGVFALLTSVYFSLSLPHGHHDDHGHGDGAHAH